ncbi:response regulator [Algibacter sp. Ld11]|uniref:response regulator n=1 Tax=Algibacter sp. Ld11 TaxID=649150 RepID=UPI00386EC73F
MMNTPVNICIVDDDDIYQFTVVKTLELLEFEKNIKVFSDGEEALEFLLDNLDKNDELPDVIFLDINMPIMDGYQFMEEYVKIKSRLGKKTVIYMVSSSVDPVDIERAKRISDISDYIIKPIEPGKLKTIMEKLIKENS